MRPFRVWLAGIILGQKGWHYILEVFAESKERGAIPKDWPSRQWLKVK